MSAQCWCFTCGGKTVSRNTFKNHGRKFEPDPPTRKRKIEMVSMLDEHDGKHSDEDDSDGEGPVRVEPDCAWWRILGKVDAKKPVGGAGLTARQIMMLLLDWMASHKATDESTRSVWRIVQACMPQDVVLPTFESIRQALRRQEHEFVERVEVCPNDCVAYVDTTHLPPPFAMKHAHRTKCPVCGERRHVKDPRSGKRVPAKVVMHFPLKRYIRSLFRRPDLVPHLYLDCGNRAEGHVSRSRGFRRKVTDNPIINKEHRNITLIGTTDGVPYFDDQVRGGWPFFYRCLYACCLKVCICCMSVDICRLSVYIVFVCVHLMYCCRHLYARCQPSTCKCQHVNRHVCIYFHAVDICWLSVYIFFIRLHLLHCCRHLYARCQPSTFKCQHVKRHVYKHFPAVDTQHVNVHI